VDDDDKFQPFNFKSSPPDQTVLEFESQQSNEQIQGSKSCAWNFNETMNEGPGGLEVEFVVGGGVK
jgi:hypothetical protein